MVGDGRAGRAGADDVIDLYGSSLIHAPSREEKRLLRKLLRMRNGARINSIRIIRVRPHPFAIFFSGRSGPRNNPPTASRDGNLRYAKRAVLALLELLVAFLLA